VDNLAKGTDKYAPCYRTQAGAWNFTGVTRPPPLVRDASGAREDRREALSQQLSRDRSRGPSPSVGGPADRDSGPDDPHVHRHHGAGGLRSGARDSAGERGLRHQATRDRLGHRGAGNRPERVSSGAGRDLLQGRLVRRFEGMAGWRIGEGSPATPSSRTTRW